MIDKNTTQQIMEIFFEYPSKEFHLRELSRVLKLSMPTIISKTDLLAKKELITKNKGKILTITSAARENEVFTRHKRAYNLMKLYDCGIVDQLIKDYNQPQLILVFGSYSRGEDSEESDVDIAVFTSQKKELILDKYSKVLKRNISIHEIDVNKISDDFRLNLANGIVLEGTW